MAEYRDPTIAPGAPIDKPAVNPRLPAATGGISRWIWIAAAVVAAIFILMMAFGGSDDVATTPVDGAVVTEPAAPAVTPADPAAEPAAPAPAQN